MLTSIPDSREPCRCEPDVPFQSLDPGSLVVLLACNFCLRRLNKPPVQGGTDSAEAESHKCSSCLAAAAALNFHSSRRTARKAVDSHMQASGPVLVDSSQPRPE